MIHTIKTEKEGLYKTNPGSFAYDNKEDIQNYRKQRSIHEAREKEIENMKCQINTLGKDISDIKEMLVAILNRT